MTSFVNWCTPLPQIRSMSIVYFPNEMYPMCLRDFDTLWKTHKSLQQGKSGCVLSFINTNGYLSSSNFSNKGLNWDFLQFANNNHRVMKTTQTTNRQTQNPRHLDDSLWLSQKHLAFTTQTTHTDRQPTQTENQHTDIPKQTTHLKLCWCINCLSLNSELSGWSLDTEWWWKCAHILISSSS